MLGRQSTASAACHDELRNFLRCRSRMRQYVPAATRALTALPSISSQPPECVTTRADSSNLSGAKADGTPSARKPVAA